MGGHDTAPQPGWPHTTEIPSHSSGDQSPKSQRPQGLTASEGSGGGLLPFLLQPLGGTGVPGWWPHHSISASVITWPSFLCVCLRLCFLLLQGQQSLGSGPSLVQGDLTLTDYICKDYFQIRSLSEGPSGHRFWEVLTHHYPRAWAGRSPPPHLEFQKPRPERQPVARWGLESACLLCKCLSSTFPARRGCPFWGSCCGRVGPGIKQG